MAYREVLHQCDYEFSLKYGKIFGFYELFRRGIYINDADLIKDIMVKDFKIFTNRRFYHFGEVLNTAIMNARDDDWRRIRSITSPAFNQIRIKSMMHSISNHIDRFCGKIEKHAKEGENSVYKFFDLIIDEYFICIDS